MCDWVLVERLDPGGGDVAEDFAGQCQRAGLGLRPVTAASHVCPGKGIECHGVARDLREREEGESVETTFAPPELLGQQEARHPLSRTTAQGPPERSSEPQSLQL